MAQLGLTLAALVAPLVTWLELDTRIVRAIYTGQHFPKPLYPYATISILAGPIFAGGRRSEKWTYDSDADQVVVEYRDQATFSFSVQFFSDDPAIHAMDLAMQALDSLQLYSTQSIFDAANMAYTSDDGVTNLDFEASDRLITRSGVAITFNTGVCTSEQFDTIESVTIEKNLSDESGTLLATSEIEIP